MATDRPERVVRGGLEDPMKDQACSELVMPNADRAATPGASRVARAYVYCAGVLAAGGVLTLCVCAYVWLAGGRGGTELASRTPRSWTLVAVAGGATVLTAACTCVLAAPGIRRKRRRMAAVRCGEEQSLSQILQGMSIAVFVINDRHIVTHWNHACERLTGVSAAEVIGTRKHGLAFYSTQRTMLADLVVDRVPVPAVVALYGAACRPSAELPGAYDFESVFQRLGSEGKWLSCTAAPVHDARGAIVGAVETFQDTTAGRRAELAMRESEEKFRGIVELTSDWVWEINQNGIYTYASSRVQDILGYSPAEVVGKTPFDFMPPEEAKRVVAIAKPLMDAHQPLAFVQNRNRHRNGHEVVLETSGMPIIDARGVFKGYRGADRDITGRKRAESVMQRQIDELTEAKRRLEVLVWNTTDREKRMVELKREVNDLLRRLGQEPKYEAPLKASELSGYTDAAI